MTLLAGVAIAGMAATAVGGIIQAQGQEYQAQAQSNMYTYQAGVAKANEQIALSNANWDRAAGEVEAQQSGERTAQKIGQTKVEASAGNLSPNVGSPTQVASSTQEVGYEDQAIKRADAAQKAYGQDIEAFQDVAQANLDTTAATTSKTAGDIAALGTMVGTAGSVASKWMDFSTKFPGSPVSLGV